MRWSGRAQLDIGRFGRDAVMHRHYKHSSPLCRGLGGTNQGCHGRDAALGCGVHGMKTCRLLTGDLDLQGPGLFLRHIDNRQPARLRQEGKVVRSSERACDSLQHAMSNIVMWPTSTPKKAIITLLILNIWPWRLMGRASAI